MFVPHETQDGSIRGPGTSASLLQHSLNPGQINNGNTNWPGWGGVSGQAKAVLDQHQGRGSLKTQDSLVLVAALL